MTERGARAEKKGGATKEAAAAVKSAKDAKDKTPAPAVPAVPVPELATDVRRAPRSSPPAPLHNQSRHHVFSVAPALCCTASDAHFSLADPSLLSRRLSSPQDGPVLDGELSTEDSGGILVYVSFEDLASVFEKLEERHKTDESEFQQQLIHWETNERCVATLR